MRETKYFIFNHEAAFAACRLERLVRENGAVRRSGEASGLFVTPLLDSGARGNMWQRVLADVRLADGASLVWRAYAADDVFATDTVEKREPAYVAENALDFIPQGTRGRYLVLTAELRGGVELHSVAVYAAWESFLDYLPEIYRDYDGFSDRFLRIFGAQYLELEQRIDSLSGTFDPAVAPESTLRRLAEIVGVPHINLWETEGLRKLLVSGIYKRRGQFSVFADYVGYFIGCRPYVAEHFRVMTGRCDNDRLYGDGDVTVFLPPDAANTEINADAVNVIIEDFLPNDIICRVMLLDAYPVVSGYAYVGVNTRVGAYRDAAVGQSRVGFGIVGGVR
ncbi:MAG: hypothetical protein LBE16_09070 [Clostridiales Family XIII bacterium]|jgi:phage tail-like protein|nr:hypothetical protein [Clostridiales Family XIII bacterium]